MICNDTPLHFRIHIYGYDTFISDGSVEVTNI